MSDYNNPKRTGLSKLLLIPLMMIFVVVSGILAGLSLSKPAIVATTPSTPFKTDEFKAVDISCPTNQFCVAVGNSIMTTNNGGQSWTLQTRLVDIRAVDCLNATDCYAIELNRFFASHDGGKTWQISQLGDPKILGYYASDLECTTVQTCYIVGKTQKDYVTTGSVVLASVDEGKTWQTRWSEPKNTNQEVSNPTAINCLADTCLVTMGKRILVSSDGGNMWAERSSKVEFDNVDCYAKETCVAVDKATSQMYTTSDWAKTWDKPLAISTKASTKFVTSELQCVKINRCYALGTENGKQAILYSANLGKNWTQVPFSFTANQKLNYISCADSSTCFVIEDTGNVWVTRNAGNNWSLSIQKGEQPETKTR